MSLYTEAADNMPKLIRLECDNCGRTQPINKERAAHNLQNGWPKCCGYTMRLITENDQKDIVEAKFNQEMDTAQRQVKALLPFDKLLEHARKNKPSQEWYDEDFGEPRFHSLPQPKSESEKRAMPNDELCPHGVAIESDDECQQCFIETCDKLGLPHDSPRGLDGVPYNAEKHCNNPACPCRVQGRQPA